MRTIYPLLVITVYAPPSDCVTLTWAPSGSITFSPLGIWVASQSRHSVISSLVSICVFSSALFSVRFFLDGSLRQDRSPIPFQRGMQGMPGQARAFHPCGELAHA